MRNWGGFSKNRRTFFAQEQKRLSYNQSLRRHIIAWAMMEDDIDTGQVKELQGGKYMAVLFLKKREYGCRSFRIFKRQWKFRICI